MSTAIDWTQSSFEDCRSTLRSWREDNPRRSEECVEIWEYVLSRYPSALGDELWPVYEQVCIAALDCARFDVAQECLAALNNQFPKSHRVFRLEGMRYEAMGKFDDALQLYETLIKKDEANSIFRKRKVAVYKAQGMVPEAVKELNEYLKKFLNDTEAWLELSELYLQEMDYAKAAFCMEELILTNPYSHLYHQRYAEIKYSQGGLDNVDLAKTYFCQAAKLNPKNVRAHFGLFLCCSHLSSTGKATGQRKRDLQKLAESAAEGLLQVYTSEATHDSGLTLKIAALESMLKTMEISAEAS